MKQKVFRLLANLKFAVSILLMISFFSIIGTIIEQDQSIEIYKINYPVENPVLGFLSWNQIIKFGLNHVYKAWWFLFLIFLLGCSLSLCSVLQQLPLLVISKRSQFFRLTNQFSRLKFSTILNQFSFNRIIFNVREKQYSLFQQKNMIYCYKGLIGQLAPIIVHFSMILILCGTVISSYFGFKAQEIISKTDTFHIQNILFNGFITTIPKTSTRINDFWILYTKTKVISQFYSDISILNNNGSEIRRKTISVNDPLIHNNIYYYQTDWNLNGLRIKIQNHKIIEYPILNIFGNDDKIGITWISNNRFSQQGLILTINNLEGYCSIYSDNGELLGNLELNETVNFKEKITFLEILSSTGLQIKTDPGIAMIYFGFFFLMISVLYSYVTYSQIWIIKKYQKIFIGGTTNRALFEFEREFFKIVV